MVDKVGGVTGPTVPRGRGVNGIDPTRPVEQAPPGSLRRPGETAPGSGPSFDGVLQQRLAAEGATVRFSAHAQQRLQRREIELGPETLAKLEGAVQRADRKGGKESLILLDDLAFVVSIKNRTVITAVDAEHMRENVFTNIDSVVIA